LSGAAPLVGRDEHDLEGWRLRLADHPGFKPSFHLSRLSPERLVEVASARQSEPHKLKRMLQGDLDWIVLKATDPERERRYDSAESFARDLERFLGHAPIEARPPSALYQSRKFIRRHRVLAGAAAAIAMALLAGLALALWGAKVAHRESVIARAEESKARELVGLLFRSFVKVVPAEGGRPDLTGRDLIAELGALADRGELKSEEVEGAVRDMLSYFALELGDFSQARTHALKGLALAQKPGGDPSQAATFHLRLGRVLKDAGHYPQSLEHFQKGLAINRRLWGDESPTTIRAVLQTARAHQLAGRESTAIQMAEDALKRARSQVGEPWRRDQLVRCLHMLAIIYQHAGRHAEQEALLQERLGIVRVQSDPQRPEALHALADFGVLRFHQQRLVESAELLSTALAGQRQRLGDAYPQTLETLIALAQCQAALRQTNEACASFNEAINSSARSLGTTSPYRRDWLKSALRYFETIGDSQRARALSEELNRLSDLPWDEVE
jgi:eukaryotic-like serine/threonine-protein kinase